MKVQIYVATQFDNFISSQNFTQRNLKAFEVQLDVSLKKYIVGEGLNSLTKRITETSSLAKSMERPPLATAPMKHLSPNKSAMGLGGVSQRNPL